MDPVHLHLILNHFPVIGPFIGIALLVVALIRKNDDLKWISLVFILVIALITIPVYTTGEPAEERAEGLAGISDTMIDLHEETALPAFIAMEITGFAAFICMFLLWKNSRLAKWNLGAIIALSLITAGLMAQTANLGGQIHHEEIRTNVNAADSERKIGNAHEEDEDNDEH